MLKERLNALIEEYVNEEGTDAQSALRDIMTDLRHIADDLNIDFDFAGVGSEEVYNEEKAEAAFAQNIADHLVLQQQMKDYQGEV